jgi:hypothetical protein
VSGAVCPWRFTETPYNPNLASDIRQRFCDFLNRNPHPPMADLKKDTVRIAPPTRPEQAAADPNSAQHDTARIVLPSRPSLPSARRVPPKITPPLASPTSSSLLQPLSKPPVIEPPPDATVRPSPPATNESATAAPCVNRGPKKETARINVFPRPSPVAGRPSKLTETQPLDTVPRSLAWGLLGVSAVIFLIQIWNYVVS